MYVRPTPVDIEKIIRDTYKLNTDLIVEDLKALGFSSLTPRMRKVFFLYLLADKPNTLKKIKQVSGNEISSDNSFLSTYIYPLAKALLNKVNEEQGDNKDFDTILYKLLDEQTEEISIVPATLLLTALVCSGKYNLSETKNIIKLSSLDELRKCILDGKILALIQKIEMETGERISVTIEIEKQKA